MIGWYPGHMVKAQRQIKENIKLVDFVVEIIDARAPLSTFNPLFDGLLKNKDRYILMTKKDMADDNDTFKFKQYFQKICKKVFICDLKNTHDIKKVINFINKQHSNILKKGLVIGVPNVGKSTFINSWVKRKSARVENRVGVTRHLQWHKNKNMNIALLDSAGISMPRFKVKEQGFNMALIGSLRLDVIPHDEIVKYFIDFLSKKYSLDMIKNRYKIQSDDYLNILNEIGYRYGKHYRDSINYDLVYELILNDFQKGLLGKITLDEIG